MINWLFINDGKVVGIVQKDECPLEADFNGVYDTIAVDDSATFKINDDFTAELQLQYNYDLWIEKGWLTKSLDTEEII